MSTTPPSERQAPAIRASFGGATLAAAIERATSALRRSQRDGDHWVGMLSSSALATAVSITALHVVDRLRHARQIATGQRWLLTTQAPDGGWGDAVVDLSNINATSLAIGALTLTQPANGDPAVQAGLQRAAKCLDDRFGGFEAVGDPAVCTLSGPCRTVAALAGLMDWRRIKHLRPEVILLPLRLRRTISTTFPAYLSIAILHASRAPDPRNVLPTFRAATQRALVWLARAQGSDGSFEESAFLTSVIIACLTAAGQRDAAPWLDAALAFVLSSQREDGSWPIDRDLETFDTDLAVFAFDAAGVPVPRAERVRDWLLRRQFDEPCFPTSGPPGGWAWAMPAGWPDTDDTAYTLLALRHLGVTHTDPAIGRGANWLGWLQARDGSWSTFVRGSRMPFDHDCPYVTGHALSALQATGLFEGDPIVLERALDYLNRAQVADGSFPSIWFREATAGTASVLEALADLDLQDLPIAQGARTALLANQNKDGGWSDRSGEASTAEETAWAVMALLRAPEGQRPTGAITRGLDWLLAHQQADGTWAPAPIGLYYSAMWYSNSMYALALPLQALARAKRVYA